jgi:hypothetical protein
MLLNMLNNHSEAITGSVLIPVGAISRQAVDNLTRALITLQQGIKRGKYILPVIFNLALENIIFIVLQLINIKL